MKFVFLYLFLLQNIIIFAQSEYQTFLNRLNSVSSSIDKSEIVDSFMNWARTKGIPFIEGDTATFLYRGRNVNFNGKDYNLVSVAIAGDVNFDGDISLELKRIPGTDLFSLRHYLEKNARLDYNYVLNGLVMISDPENPNILPWGRIGVINEIAMPDFEQPDEIIFYPEIPHGSIDSFTITNNKNFVTTNHTIKVQLPAGYNPTSNERYPVAYFHDGSFYFNYGKVNNIVDNLIYEKRIKPIIAVYVDHSPGNRVNEYYFQTERFIDFFNYQLVPYIDQKYKTTATAENRAVIGLSFGGNISALIVNSVKDMYKNCGIHSGAIWPNNFDAAKKIYNNDFGIKYYMVWGTYETEIMNNCRMVRDSLIAKGYSHFQWGEYPQGHSMGFWRSTTDIFLEYFFSPENTTGIMNTDEHNFNSDFQLDQNYPNPFNPETNISFLLKKQGFVKIKVYDLLGREIETLVNEYKNEGYYNVNFHAAGLSSGNYFYSMQFGGKFILKKMSIIK